MPDIPLHRHFQTFANTVGGLVTQKSGGFADISQGMAHITGAEVAVDGLGIFEVRKSLAQVVTKMNEEVIEAGAVADSNIVHLIGSGGVFAGGGEQVGLDGVVDVTEVAAGFAIAVDIHRLILDHGVDPFRDDRRIGAVGVLPLTEDIEVTQADGLEAVGAGEDVGVKFVDQFGNGIGRERFADLVFHFGQVGVVTIGRAAGGIDEALDLGIAGGNEHVKETVDIVLVGGDGVFDGAGY